MVNIQLLEEEIEDLGITKTRIAEKCGFTRQTLDNKMKNPDLMTANDVFNIAEALRITDPNKIIRIFFAPKVHKN